MSAHPELVKNGSFRHLKLGRAAKREDPRTLQLRHYLDESVLPSIPPSCDWSQSVSGWPMYANDRLGDCTCAAAGHMIQGWSAACGQEKTPAEQDVVAAYIPGTGTDDTGRAEIDVLNYWRQTGIGGDKIDAWVAVDPSNVDHVKAAIYLFGGVYTGIALPLTAQSQSVWDVVPAAPDQNEPGSWGGHAVPYLAYDADGFTCVTWGHPLKLTTAFHNEYTDEAYAAISPDFFKNNATPSGFNLDQLQADLLELMEA